MDLTHVNGKIELLQLILFTFKKNYQTMTRLLLIFSFSVLSFCNGHEAQLEIKSANNIKEFFLMKNDQPDSFYINAVCLDEQETNDFNLSDFFVFNLSPEIKPVKIKTIHYENIPCFIITRFNSLLIDLPPPSLS